MHGGIFRKVALERLSSPEQLDQLMQVTSPRGWLALVGLGSLLVVVVIWAIFGTVETTEVAQGILIRGGGVQVIEAPGSGQVARIYVRAGDVVAQGQPVAAILPSDQGDAVMITSPQAGRVLEVRVNEGSVIQGGTPLLSLELSNQDLQAILYLQSENGQSLRPGMTVFISPASVKKEEFGVMLGKVTSVGDFPATYQGMLRVLGSDELVRSLSGGAAPIEVRVEPVKASTASGYQWSSSQGPPFAISSGTFCTASIIIEEQRPINLVFGRAR